jgi:hypothetical protein
VLVVVGVQRFEDYLEALLNEGTMALDALAASRAGSVSALAPLGHDALVLDLEILVLHPYRCQ